MADNAGNGRGDVLLNQGPGVVGKGGHPLADLRKNGRLAHGDKPLCGQDVYFQAWFITVSVLSNRVPQHHQPDRASWQQFAQNLGR
jgi:hypothetical protein